MFLLTTLSLLSLAGGCFGGGYYGDTYDTGSNSYGGGSTSTCSRFVDAWNACADGSGSNPSGHVDASACSGESDDALDCAAYVLETSDCSTEASRSDAFDAALACGLG